MAENLFGRVPVGGITPSEFKLDLDPLFKERQADVADRQVAVSEKTLELNEEKFNREKLVEDRTLKLAALKQVAGFDVSNLPNHLAVSMKFQLDEFERKFKAGEYTPEGLQTEAYRLGSVFQFYGGHYEESKGYIEEALTNNAVLTQANLNVGAGKQVVIGESIVEMNNKAGLFWEEGTYDLEDNTGVFKVLNSDPNYQGEPTFTELRMTLDEAFDKVASGQLKIPTISSTGPYTTTTIDVPMIGLVDVAKSAEILSYIQSKTKDKKFEKENAEEAFDNYSRPDGSKATKSIRGAIRTHLEGPGYGISFTEEEAIAFDNGDMDAIAQMKQFTNADGTNIDTYNKLMERVREDFVEMARYESEEKAKASDITDYQRKAAAEKAKLKADQDRFKFSIQSNWKVQPQPNQQLTTSDLVNVLQSVSIPVDTDEPLKVSVASQQGEISITGLTITPDRKVYISGTRDTGVVGSPPSSLDNKLIPSAEVATIFNAINQAYSLEGDDRMSIDNVLEKAANREYEQGPSTNAGSSAP